MKASYRDTSGRRTLLQFGGAATLLAATGALGRSRNADALRTLRIGVALPRSGYLRGAGDACFEGVRLAASLLPQLGFPHFEPLEADTGEGLESARSAALQLFDAGVSMLVGCFDSGQTEVVAALAEERRVPMVINVGAAPSITEQGYRYVFRVFPDAVRIVTDSYELQKQLFVATGWAPKRVVVMHIDNGRGIDLVDRLWPQNGMPYEKAPSIAYDPREIDLSDAVERARDSGADALWTVSRADDAIRIVREAVRLKWEPRLVMSSNAGLHERSFLEALGRNAEYAVTFAPYYDPRKPLSVRLRAELARMRPGAELGTLQVYSFEAMMVALDAARRARSREPDALASALRATDLRANVSPGPGIRFDAKGQNRSVGLIALQNLRGRGRVVLPKASAEAAPVLPAPTWSERS